MRKEIKDLIEISRFYGKNKDYTLAGGGNTSFKDEKHIWVKASGSSLADINEDGFAVLDRNKVSRIGTKEYSNDPNERENQIKEDLITSNVDLLSKKRPSVETSLHDIIRFAYVVHLHPTLVNSLMCSNYAEKITRELFGDKVMFVIYAPGYELFKIVQREIETYRLKYGTDPAIIFLQNHGVFVGAETPDEIKNLYEFITDTIKSKINIAQNFEDLPVNDDVISFLPAIRMILSSETNKVIRLRHNKLVSNFYKNQESFLKASLPFIPDIIVYCKGSYMYLDDTSSPENIIKSFLEQLPGFISKNGYPPKILMIKNYGIIAVEDNVADAETALDVYEDLLKISYLSESFGGPHFMTKEEIAFIDSWEVENYRRKISKGESVKSVADQKIMIVTGGAQGFGEGISESLIKENANIIIADLNEQRGNETVERLSSLTKKNHVSFCKTDVSDPVSVNNLIIYTVKEFGGLDVIISNAGILKAGGLSEMDAKTFEIMTKVNFEGYFLCVKYASEVMKLQSKYKADHYMDVIQINSKSGLRGSNKNFTYAGGKFGGIGLTQSFALELAPFHIKVNSVCPGNFFEGPLWSDPNSGLFVQYLKAGKVAGAKTIDDVKRFYEKQVPLERGCRVEDVMKAILYIISQEYETGQAVPVTGGQVMLSS